MVSEKLMSYPFEIAYLSLPNQELTNSVLLVQMYRNKIVSPSGSPWFTLVDRKIFECRNVFVLRPLQLKLNSF